MTRLEKSVFISYRRADRYTAVLVFKDLTQHGYDAFIDYDGIASGDFEGAILDNIRSRAHFVVLLTPTALERCDDSADWLRREIEAAIAQRRNIVPVLLDGFDFGSSLATQRLQGTLEPLKQYQALRIPKEIEYFDHAMARLRGRHLAVQVEAVLHPPSPHAQQVAQQQHEVASKAAALASPAESTTLPSAGPVETAGQGAVRGRSAVTKPSRVTRLANPLAIVLSALIGGTATILAPLVTGLLQKNEASQPQSTVQVICNGVQAITNTIVGEKTVGPPLIAEPPSHNEITLKEQIRRRSGLIIIELTKPKDIDDEKWRRTLQFLTGGNTQLWIPKFDMDSEGRITSNEVSGQVTGKSLSFLIKNGLIAVHLSRDKSGTLIGKATVGEYTALASLDLQ